MLLLDFNILSSLENVSTHHILTWSNVAAYLDLALNCAPLTDSHRPRGPYRIRSIIYFEL